MQYDNYIALFEQTVRRWPERTALVDMEGNRGTTYAALDRLSGQVAGKIKAMGLDKGEFVLVCMDRRTEYMAAYLGVLKAGCVVVNVCLSIMSIFKMTNIDKKLDIRTK